MLTALLLKWLNDLQTIGIGSFLPRNPQPGPTGGGGRKGRKSEFLSVMEMGGILIG